MRHAIEDPQTLDVGEARISREQLVAAIAAQRDFHVPRRELGHDEGRDRGGIAEGLVEVPHQPLHQPHGIRTHQDFVMVGLVKCGHLRGGR